jgi:hypothetical protein
MAAYRSVLRRFFRILLIVIAVHVVVIAGLHIWFVNNARGVLSQIVTDKSGGKLKLKLSKLSFDFISNKLQVREADLESTDTLTQPATYHVKFRKLTLRIHSFWPLILQKRLLLDSIKLHDPVIDVMLWRKDTASAFARDDLSVPREMGKLYNSMLDVLDGFGIRRIIINNASVSLINKMKPGSKPVAISNVYLDVIRTAGNTDTRDEFVADAQTVDLRTANQNIALPGGRHQLSFKTFTLQLFRRHIELDSCTITALPTSSSKSSYQIFFSKLLLIGVDFNAMYLHNLIRADSVYCENPSFDINLITTDTGNKKERPDPEKIVRELTGDLDLAFVGVKDAGININISGNKSRSLFNSNKDNFEMRGLRINSDSSVPVMVQQFDMLVRDYRLYNEDSSTAYSFDSITFKNNKIVLNNFSVTTNSGRYAQRSFRDYKIPYFELTGLDWYQLVFEENLKAREAVLYNPVINYTRNMSPVRRKKANLFASLQTIDDLVTLEKLNIINGKINMKMGSSLLNFQDVNLSIYTNRLLKSTNKEGLRKAVDLFSFSTGFLKLKDITARLHNVRYTGTNLIHADRILIDSKSKRISGSINDVFIDNMLMDEEMETVVVDGLRWDKATVSLQSSASSNRDNKATRIHLKNISGNDTRFNLSNKGLSVSTIVDKMEVTSILKFGNQPLQTTGLFMSGHDFSLSNGPLKLHAGGYQIRDEQPSFLSQVSFERFLDSDSLKVESARIGFSANINELLAKDFHIKDLDAKGLIVKLQKWNSDTAAATASQDGPSVRIDKITANEPDIYISTSRNDSVTVFRIPSSSGSVIKASDLKLEGGNFLLGNLVVRTNAATLAKPTGEIMGVEKGNVDLELSDFKMSKKDNKPVWSGLINNFYLQNPNSLIFGKYKNKLVFNDVSIGNFRLSSDYLADFNQLVKFNISAWLRSKTGYYVDSTTTMKWFNADYNYVNRTLSLDSFAYFPTQQRDSVILKTPHQVDYITFHSGAIRFTDFNLEKYKQDSALFASTISIKNPLITIYRDKKPPFLSGIIKPLPVNLIRRISLPVSVSRVNLIDGNLVYTERNAKSRAEGTVSLTHLHGSISNIKNRGFEYNDSLGLTLRAYLMDSALLDLKVKESYTDTLGGFLMTLQMKPTSLTFLNPVLAPLSNVIITSGTIDSFHLRAIGKEHLALGEMNMYYHNLRIKLVKPGEPDNTTFKSRLATFLANALVIKKNNNGRTGLVYFERLRDRSFFNYLVKMTFSGMATSIGVKKNRKVRRQYEKELKNNNLPPIEWE